MSFQLAAMQFDQGLRDCQTYLAADAAQTISDSATDNVGNFSPAEAPRRVPDLLVQAPRSPTFTRLEMQLGDLEARVRQYLCR